MRGKLIPGLFFSLLILAPLAGLALHYNQDKESVVWEMGEPNGKRQLATGEIWVYSGDITLEFRNGLLVRSKGVDLQPALQEPEPANVDQQPDSTDENEISSEEPVAEESSGTVAEETTSKSRQETDDELLEMADSISNPEAYREAVEQMQEEYDPPPSSRTMLQTVLGIVVPTVLQWIFLIIAFKWVGAEALKSALFLIALVDRLVILGVQWVFHSLLTYPTTFHADTLISFIVMLGMITSITHAKQLPTAIKVVVAAKVAGFVTGFLFLLFILHYL